MSCFNSSRGCFKIQKKCLKGGLESAIANFRSNKKLCTICHISSELWIHQINFFNCKTCRLRNFKGIFDRVGRIGIKTKVCIFCLKFHLTVQFLVHFPLSLLKLTAHSFRFMKIIFLWLQIGIYEFKGDRLELVGRTCWIDTISENFHESAITLILYHPWLMIRRF